MSRTGLGKDESDNDCSEQPDDKTVPPNPGPEPGGPGRTRARSLQRRSGDGWQWDSEK